MKSLHKLYLALRYNKVMHYEQYYIITYDIVDEEYLIWYVDGLKGLHVFSRCVSKAVLDFTWEILMGRGKLCVAD